MRRSTAMWARNSSTAEGTTMPGSGVAGPDATRDAISAIESLQAHHERLAHHPQEQRAHAGEETVRFVAADREQARARQRQQRARLHLPDPVAVEQGVLVRMQAAADRLAFGQ